MASDPAAKYTLDVNHGTRRLKVAGGRSLLATLKGQGLFIPSACGGRGLCGTCRMKVRGKAGPITDAEHRLLAPADRRAGLRLACQVKVESDLEVEVPETLLRARSYRGTVERIRDLTHDIKELRIRIVVPDAIEFRPGQYVLLETPAYGHVTILVYRAYSLSSPPGDNRHIELIVRHVPGGICTTWVFMLLKEGDTVRFNGPYGEFCLHDSQREMIWIAGGSGIAPFWCLARHMKETAHARPCTFFHGAVERRDLALYDEFRRLQAETPWLRYVPALSAPARDDNWNGERGLITEVVDRRLHNAAGMEAYLCGSSGMIEAALKTLRAKGVPQAQIYHDKFD